MVFLTCAISYFLLLLTLNVGISLCAAALGAFLGLPTIGMNTGFIFGIVIVTTVLAMFAAALVFVFNSTLSTGAFTAVFVLVSLFLSGGIIPIEFFSSNVQLLANFVFNTWSARLLASGLTGENLLLPFAMCILFGSIFAVIGCIAANLRGRTNR